MYEAFAKYVRGEVPFLPWCEVPLQAETSTISQDLVAINKAGFLTINSQVRGRGQWCLRCIDRSLPPLLSPVS